MALACASDLLPHLDGPVLVDLHTRCLQPQRVCPGLAPRGRKDEAALYLTQLTPRGGGALGSVMHNQTMSAAAGDADRSGLCV